MFYLVQNLENERKDYIEIGIGLNLRLIFFVNFAAIISHDLGVNSAVHTA